MNFLRRIQNKRKSIVKQSTLKLVSGVLLFEFLKKIAFQAKSIRRFFSEISFRWDKPETCFSQMNHQIFGHIRSLVRNMDVDQSWRMTLLFGFVIQQLSCSLIALEICKKGYNFYNRSIHFAHFFAYDQMAYWMSNTNSWRQWRGIKAFCALNTEYIINNKKTSIAKHEYLIWYFRQIGRI